MKTDRMHGLNENELKLVSGGIIDDICSITHDITTIIREIYEDSRDNSIKPSNNHSGGGEGTW